MRVVGGKYRNRRLRPPGAMEARPTTDFAKEGLFNILAHGMELEGIRVLDLFSGTGSISLEFLSRGARAVVSVDQDQRLLDFQKRMALELEEPGWSQLRADVFSLLSSTPDRSFRLLGSEPFDLIFADPPFGLAGSAELPGLVRDSGLLASDGRFILEHPREIDPGTDPWFERQRRFGSVIFSFFKPQTTGQ